MIECFEIVVMFSLALAHALSFHTLLLFGQTHFHFTRFCTFISHASASKAGVGRYRIIYRRYCAIFCLQQHTRADKKGKVYSCLTIL
jgi:hypothetical protein